MKFFINKIAIALTVLVPGILVQNVNASGKAAATWPLAPDTISVKKFGAKGDNIQNDSAAFQTAISYASKNGKVLFVPKGVYRVSNVVLYPNITMVGEDSSSILVLTNGTQSNRQCLSLTG